MTTNNGETDRTGALALSRRLFLVACAGLIAPSAGCSSIGSRIRAAYAFGSDPPLAHYREILRALVRTVLPCEDRAFPVSDDVVVSRLLELFELETDERFLAVQQTLIFFDDVELFAESAPFLEAERVAVDAEARSTPPEQLRERSKYDAARYAEFAASHNRDARRFVHLTLADQRAYFALWGRSAFIVKRRFVAAARALIMVSAYSMDTVWAVVGYEGPILRR